MQGLLGLDARVAAISIAELWMGAYRADSDERFQHRQGFVNRVSTACEVLPFGTNEARRFGQLWAELAGRGQMIGERDLQIAATALANGHTVMTSNPRDFLRVPGLSV